MLLTKIDYTSLNSKQKEIFNFQKISGILSDYGYNCIKLADDWQGVDFLAYHINGKTTLKVQLKSRITIAKKYLGKDIFIGFPSGDDWCMIEHDRLVELIGKSTQWLDTKSWTNIHGAYSATKLSQKLLSLLDEYKL